MRWCSLFLTSFECINVRDRIEGAGCNKCASTSINDRVKKWAGNLVEAWKPGSTYHIHRGPPIYHTTYERYPSPQKQRRWSERTSQSTMTDMYDEKRVPDFSLPPYQHEDHGGPVSFLWRYMERPKKIMTRVYLMIACIFWVHTNSSISPLTHILQHNIIWHQDGLGRAKNPVKYLQSIEQRARERQVAYETVRLLRQDVIACYRKEGVNHYENCKEPVEKYARVVLKRDVGQVNPTWSEEGKNYGVWDFDHVADGCYIFWR